MVMRGKGGRVGALHVRHVLTVAPVQGRRRQCPVIIALRAHARRRRFMSRHRGRAPLLSRITPTGAIPTRRLPPWTGLRALRLRPGPGSSGPSRSGWAAPDLPAGSGPTAWSCWSCRNSLVRGEGPGTAGPTGTLEPDINVRRKSRGPGHGREGEMRIGELAAGSGTSRRATSSGSTSSSACTWPGCSAAPSWN